MESNNLIMDKSHIPSMEEIAAFIGPEARKMWLDMTGYIEAEFKSKPQITYSICAGKPGWNVKYKKSGKALCTLYPEKDLFIALVVLGQDDRDNFDATRDGYGTYVKELYDNCKLFNGTKWLMISVMDINVYEDVKKLMMLKVKK